MKMHLRNSWLVFPLLLAGCAQKETRLWIEPPKGANQTSGNRSLYYRTEDVASGKKESLAIPVNQLPESLVLEDHTGKKTDEGATKADQLLSGEKPAEKSGAAPTLSYLRGVQEAERLYRKRQYPEALIKIAPLIEQYPDQPRLFLMQGTLYRKMGEKKMAVAAFQRAHDLDKANPNTEEALLKARDEAGVTP